MKGVQTAIFQVMNKAHIISIGNELLIGDTVNTNATWLGGYLNEQGFSVDRVITLPDEYNILYKVLSESFHSADLTIVTGGLGPTHDDITKKVLADLLDTTLKEDKNVLRHIQQIFEQRGFTFSQSNADQALVPRGCDVLFNKKGTAPGLWAGENGRFLAVLPGVPHEMKYLTENEITPKLDTEFPGRKMKTTLYFHTAGVPESTLSDDVLGDLSHYLNNGLDIAFLPNAGGVKVRVGFRENSDEVDRKELNNFRSMVLERAGDVIYGEGKECTLAAVLGELLTEKNMTIAVAESCTGGRISDMITDVPGCSDYMLGGVIAYANDTKTNQLGVSGKDLGAYGAVSSRVAIQMAKGVADRLEASVGVSSTGIAGPGGGTAEKPVGTVWMGFCIGKEQFAIKGIFTEDREINKQRTAAVVLETVRRRLSGIEALPYNLKPVFS